MIVGNLLIFYYFYCIKFDIHTKNIINTFSLVFLSFWFQFKMQISSYSHVQIEENVNLEGKSDTKTLRKN